MKNNRRTFLKGLLGSAAALAAGSQQDDSHAAQSQDHQVFLPIILNEEVTTFAFVGDYGIETPEAAQVGALIRSWDPAAVMTLGDNNYEYGSSSTIVKNTEPYHMFINEGRFYPAIGDHDWWTNNARPYREYFNLPGNERYYDFVHSDVHFFVLNSVEEEYDGVEIGSRQYEYFEAAAQASTARWKIVYFHHTPYTSGKPSYAEYMRWPFEALGMDAVVSADKHIYERLHIGGIPYFVNGLGGKSKHPFREIEPRSQARYNDEFGALKLRVSHRALTFDFINMNGVLIDSHSYQK